MTFSPTFLKRHHRCLMPLPQRFGILGTKLNVLGSSISRVGRTWFGRLIDAGTLGHVFYEEVQYEAQVFFLLHSSFIIPTLFTLSISYDIQRAVTDGATVPIYYESRLAKLELKESERPKIDPEFEEATEGEEVERREKLKTKWASSKLSSVPRTVSSLSPATWLSISTIGSRSWTARLWSSV